MKFILNSFILTALLAIECLAQSDYDRIRIEDISFEYIPLSDLPEILNKIGDKVSRKIYTPPEGDTDEYDKIHYYENNDIKLKLYEISGDLILSSITLKTDKYQFGLQEEVYRVCSPYSILSGFKKSFDKLLKQQSNIKLGMQTEFHLNLIHPNGAQGILTMEIKEDLIIQISISLNSA